MYQLIVLTSLNMSYHQVNWSRFSSKMITITHEKPKQISSTQTISPPVGMPPAKKTKPEGNDAAANRVRPCPRPPGKRVQMLLEAL